MEAVTIRSPTPIGPFSGGTLHSTIPTTASGISSTQLLPRPLYGSSQATRASSSRFPPHVWSTVGLPVVSIEVDHQEVSWGVPGRGWCRSANYCLASELHARRGSAPKSGHAGPDSLSHPGSLERQRPYFSLC